jgi:hypothetical protein
MPRHAHHPLRGHFFAALFSAAFREPPLAPAEKNENQAPMNTETVEQQSPK